jgi:hypothetical protein
MGNSPNWSYKYVPTTAEWNFWFGAKQDDLSLSAASRIALVAGAGLPNGFAKLDAGGLLPQEVLPANAGNVLLSGTPSGGQIAEWVDGTHIQGSATTGTGGIVRAAAPTLSNPIVGTQPLADNSTKAASTAYVEMALASVKAYGAKGDGVDVTSSVSIASGDAALTVSGASFASADVGKVIAVPGAGTAGATLWSTISARTSSTQVTLANAASTTLSVVSKTVSYGTDDTAGIQAAVNHAVSNSHGLYVPAGIYFVSNITLPHDTRQDSGLKEHLVPAINFESGAAWRKTNGGVPNYLLASGRWADNTGYSNSPIIIRNGVFDGFGIAYSCYEDISYWSTYEKCVFKNAVYHGYHAPQTTMNVSTPTTSRSNTILNRCMFHDNGYNGIYVDPGAVAVADFWFIDNIAYNNKRENVNILQSAGWVIKGNHCYYTVAPSSGTASAIVQGDYSAPFSGNIWEGYSTTHYGLRLVNSGTHVTLEGDSFEVGLGLDCTFIGSEATTRVLGCSFHGSSTLNHGTNNATTEVRSIGNVFEASAPYTWSGGGAGVINAIGDTINGNRFIIEGTQTSGSVTGRAIRGITYPGAFPYSVTSATKDVIRCTAALAADITITFPASPLTGLRYRVIRTATATGAYNILLKNSGGTTVGTMSTAAKFFDMEFDGTAWIITAAGDAA